MHRYRGVFVFLSASVLLASLQGIAEAQEGEQQNGGRLVIAVTAPEAPPVIDGKLDDACWQKAGPYDSFYCPDWNGTPPEKTQAYITADAKALYVAVRCEDKSPDDIVANETRRNGDVWNEDNVDVFVDPAGQRKDFYDFRVTARGTQREDIPGGSASKIEWRGDWNAAAVRTDYGWSAELAIPYSILRFPPGQSTFNLGIQRQFGRERVSAVWPNLGKSWDRSLCADITGLHPEVAVKRVVWMPYSTLDLGGGGSTAGSGMDVQYKLANGLTVLGAYNPDFTQIEDVVEPISFSYTERYLPDRRPFFVTGQDGFLPQSMLLYTRRIGDFDAGAKLFGTLGSETYGFLDALTFGGDNSLAMQWGHKFNDSADMKTQLVSYSPEAGPANVAFGIEGGHTWRQPEGGGRDVVWGNAFFTRDGELGMGSALLIGGFRDHGLGTVQYDWGLRRVTSDFHPTLGYAPEVDNIGGWLNLRQTWLYEKGDVYGRQWMVSMGYWPRLESNGMLSQSIAPGYAWLTKNGQLWVVQVEKGEYEGLNSSGLMFLHAWRDNDTYHRGEVTAVAGPRGGGDLAYLHLIQRLKPSARLAMAVEAEWIHLVMPDPSESQIGYQTIVTTSYDITTEKSVAARCIATQDGLSVYAAYRQAVRRGLDAYVILGDPDPARTGFVPRVAVKLIQAF
jgi:hypothetical protein